MYFVNKIYFILYMDGYRVIMLSTMNIKLNIKEEMMFMELLGDHGILGGSWRSWRIMALFKDHGQLQIDSYSQ